MSGPLVHLRRLVREGSWTRPAVSSTRSVVLPRRRADEAGLIGLYGTFSDMF
jgi:hypothetical protein